MTYVYAWLLAFGTSFGLEPEMLPGGSSAPTMFMPPPPPPPPATEQAPASRPTKSGAGQNDIYNGF